MPNLGSDLFIVTLVISIVTLAYLVYCDLRLKGHRMREDAGGLVYFFTFILGIVVAARIIAWINYGNVPTPKIDLAVFGVVCLFAFLCSLFAWDIAKNASRKAEKP